MASRWTVALMSTIVGSTLSLSLHACRRAVDLPSPQQPTSPPGFDDTTWDMTSGRVCKRLQPRSSAVAIPDRGRQLLCRESQVNHGYRQPRRIARAYMNCDGPARALSRRLIVAGRESVQQPLPTNPENSERHGLMTDSCSEDGRKPATIRPWNAYRSKPVLFIPLRALAANACPTYSI
jgi:hypothetical protein